MAFSSSSSPLKKGQNQMRGQIQRGEEESVGEFVGVIWVRQVRKFLQQQSRLHQKPFVMKD
jgi:hypothetical protein